MGNRLKSLEVAERRAIIAELKLRGMKNHEIADTLNIDPNRANDVIAGDLRSIKKQWKETALQDFDTLKAKHYAELEALQKALWKMLERSQEESTDTMISVRKVRPLEPKELPIRSKGVSTKSPLAVGNRKISQTARILKMIDISNLEDADEETVNEVDETSSPSQVASSSPPSSLIVDSETTNTSKSKRDGCVKIAGQILAVIHEKSELMGLLGKAGSASASPPVVSFMMHVPAPESEQLENRGTFNPVVEDGTPLENLHEPTDIDTDLENEAITA
jgi:hypothetical protein